MANVNKRSKGKQYGKKNLRSSGKGKSSCERDTDRISTRDTIDAGTVRTNNPAWYSPNAQLVKDVASFPYGLALGTKLHYGTASEMRYMNNNAMPGIMRINFTPTMGWSDSASSPLNIVGKNLYTYIRSANSGARNYDYPDLMLYYIAMDSAYGYLSHLRRIYGLLGTTNYMNRYYPEGIVTALNANYSDLVGNMADFRAYINMYALKLQSYVMPAHASYFARHDWLMNNVFSDTGLGKDQTYVFVPDGFYQFGLDDFGAGTCSLVTFKDAGPWGPKWTGTFEQFKKYGDMLLDAIVGNPGAEDFNTISGDILKAYGEGNVVRANIITDDYSIVPIVDEEALAQIQNATALGDVKVAFVQSSNKAYIVSTPRVELTAGNDEAKKRMMRLKADICTMDRFVNLYKDNPEPADTMVATRLTVVPSVTKRSDTAYFMNYNGCGSEIVTSFECYHYTFDAESSNPTWKLVSTGKLDSFPIVYGKMSSNTTADTGSSVEVLVGQFYSMMEQFSYLSAFRYHPYQIYGVVGWDVATSREETAISPVYYGDTSNYAMLDDDSLRSMHETALLAQLGFENYRTSSK